MVHFPIPYSMYSGNVIYIYTYNYEKQERGNKKLETLQLRHRFFLFALKTLKEPTLKHPSQRLN